MQNNPLYLEVFQTTNDAETLKFHHIAHCSLDAVEEKRKSPVTEMTTIKLFIL